MPIGTRPRWTTPSLPLPSRRCPSRSGKSTLVKILSGQQEPGSGKLRFMNRPLAEWGNREFARELAYLPQQLPSAAGLRVRELVSVGRYPWHGTLGRFTGEDRRQVEAAMNLAGVAGLADRLVDTLSGGERQRVWLAMLVAHSDSIARHPYGRAVLRRGHCPARRTHDRTRLTRRDHSAASAEADFRRRDGCACSSRNGPVADISALEGNPYNTDRQIRGNWLKQGSAVLTRSGRAIAGFRVGASSTGCHIIPHQCLIVLHVTRGQLATHLT